MRYCILAAVAALVLSSCSSVPKIVRTERPELIVVKEEIRYHVAGGRGTDFVIPAGNYPYTWEDKGNWYFENGGVSLQANIRDRIPVSRPGGFAVAKEYDQIAVYLLCEGSDMAKRDCGELVIAMLPKRSGKIVSLEGVVPKEIEARFEIIGHIPVK